MRRTFVLILLLNAGLLSQPLVPAQEPGMAVRVDGRTLFRVGPTDWQDAQTRARQIERRLTLLLQHQGPIPAARIEPSPLGSPARQISVSGVPVIIVTESDAQDHLTSPENLAAQWAQLIDAALQRGHSRRLGAWGRLTAEVQASVEAAFARLAESARAMVPRALAALLVLGIFWALAAGARRLMRLIFHRFVEDQTVEHLIKQLTYYAIWAIGLIVAVDALGFDPQAVATGVGLVGLALGFALRDILSNFVSGVLLLTLRPFQLGDQIVVGDTEGSVERIELRATQIRTYDGRVVLVPNAELFTSRVTNNTAAPVRRASVTLYLGYDTDLQRVGVVARRVVQATEGVLHDRPVSVLVRDLGPADMVIEARFWADSRRSDFLATISAVRAALVAALQAAGVELPDPAVRWLAPRDPDRWRVALGAADDTPSEHGQARRQPDSVGDGC